VTAEQGAARGGAILVIRFAVTSLLNYLLGVALAWILAPAQFGVVGTVQALLLLTGLVLGAGVPWALASRAAVAGPNPSGAERAAVARLFRSGLLLNTVVGVVLAAVVLVVQVAGLRLIPSTSPVLLGATAATLPVLSFNAVLAGMLQGSRRFGGLGALQSCEVVVKSVVAVVLAAGAGMGADGVALGFLAGACAASAVGLWSLRDLWPGRGHVLAALVTFRVSGPFWVGSASMGLLPTVDLLGLQLVGARSGVTTATLAAYQVCGILARSIYYVGDALIDAVFPFMASRRGTPGSHAWFVAAARWLPLGLVPLQLALTLAPAPVLALFFPAAYADVAGLLRVLNLGAVGMIVAGMLVKGLYANGQAARVASRTAVAAAVEIVAIAVLVPRLGASGAAGAFTLGSWTAAVLLAVAYARVQAVVHPLTGPRAGITTRYAASLAGCAAVLTVAQRRPDPAGIALLLVALVIFYLLAAAFQVLPAEDVGRVRRLVAGAAGTAARTFRTVARTFRSAGRLLLAVACVFVAALSAALARRAG
jgi:O-antigen/teichoic acid export membrane protein